MKSKFIFLISAFILFFSIFSLHAQKIESDGRIYEFKENFYGVLEKKTIDPTINQISNQKSLQINNKALNQSGDILLQKLGDYQIFQRDQSANQIQSNNFSPTFTTKEVLFNSQTNRPAIVHHILLKYRNKNDLLMFVSQNPNLQVLNTIEAINLAVINPKSNTSSTVALYLDLLNKVNQGLLVGIERISLDLFENPQVPQ